MSTTLLSVPSGEALSRFRDLNDRACCLTAWKEAQEWAPLRDWNTPAARIEAARLLRGLGDDRLSNTLHYLNARQFPNDPVHFIYTITDIANRRGTVPVLQDLKRGKIPKGLTTEQLADLAATEASLYSSLRDFGPAWEAMKRALELRPDSWWIATQHSRLLTAEDRYDEAMEVARRAFDVLPTRPAPAMQLIDCLIYRNRDDEAIELLEKSHEAGESSRFAERLVHLYSERDDHQKALFYLDEIIVRKPLMDRDWLRWHRRRRADMLYLAEDFEGFLREADELPEKSYHRRVAVAMRLPGALEGKRKKLEVPFVRQHSMTCAPATLTAIAAYWGREVDHLAVTEAICYEGTPWHKERTWAEENGFHTREFRLTEEILITLIDRGIPFTLTTQAIGGGHLQACIGYDQRQKITILRDPTERHYGEIITEALLEDHPVQGPRCLLLLPEEERARLTGLTLPDEVVYDLHHLFSIAMEEHDREAAQAAIRRMPEGHPLALWSEYKLACYDRNPVAAETLTDQMVERFPDNTLLRYWRLGAVQRKGDFQKERKLIEAELTRPDCDPIFYSEMGDLLSRDARHADLTSYYLRKAIRLRWRTASCYASMSDFLSNSLKLKESVDYQRATTCLEPSWEPYAERYASICRFIGQGKEGITFLRQRVERQGRKDSGPWLTLARELDRQNRATEELQVLEEALVVHPEDGALWLEAGAEFVYHGHQERGVELIRGARGKVREAQWNLSMARIHGFLGQRVEALVHWREYVRLEPHSEEGHRALARALADEEGPDAAITYLEEATAALPHFVGLWVIRADWESDLKGPAAAIPSMERAVALDPDANWRWRSLALYRFRAGQREAAFADLQEALHKDPASPANLRIHGMFLSESSRKEEAREAYRKALRLDIDDAYAASGLLEAVTTLPERLAELVFIEGEMSRQVSNGDIVTEYRSLAYNLLEPTDLLQRLHRFCRERPDLWQTWQALLSQALDMELYEEANRFAQELTDRFPLLPRAWMEKARVEKGDAEIEAFQKAVSLSPDWAWANTELATALERGGRYDEALEILKANCARNPLEGPAYGFLADLLWKMGQKEEGFLCLLKGMSLCPRYNWGWNRLGGWALKLDRTGEVVETMKAHVPREGHRIEWWDVYSDTLREMKLGQEALNAIEEGMSRLPERPALYEQKSFLLCDEGRYGEALATCEEALAFAPDQVHLQGRRAWIKMQLGKPVEAMADMRRVLEQQPDYIWGLRQLIGWLENRNEWTEVLVLAKQWVRHEPRSGDAYFSLAHAHSQQSEPNAAASKAAYAKAFEISPDQIGAGRNLLTCQIKDGELDAAAKTLQTLEHYHDSPYLKGDAVELALAGKDHLLAEQLGKVLLEDPETPAGIYQWMANLFSEAQRGKVWTQMLNKAAKEQAEPSAALIEAWIRSHEKITLFSGIRRRLAKLHQEGVRAHGWVTLLARVTQEQKWLFRYMIWREREWLASQLSTWEEVGEAYLTAGFYTAAYRWFKAGRFSRDEISASCWFNQAAASETVEGWTATIPEREEFVRRFPNLSLACSTRPVIGLFYALEGRMDEARSLYLEMEEDSISRYYSSRYYFLRSLLEADCDNHEYVKEAYQKGIEISNSFLYERATAEMIKAVQIQLASHTSWTKGKGRAIRREWGAYKSRFQFSFNQLFIGGFGLYLILILLKRFIQL